MMPHKNASPERGRRLLSPLRPGGPWNPDAARGGKPRILFLHSPAHPHRSHLALADRLGAVQRAAFAPPGRRRLPTSIRTAWALSRRKDWDALLAEGPCFEGAFLRLFDRRRRRIARLDSQNSSLTMAYDRSLTRLVRRLEFRSWDALVVIGDAGERATRALVSPTVPVIAWVPPVTAGDEFGRVVADRRGPAISLITGGNPHRVTYKGLDRVAAFSRVAIDEGWGPVVVYGAWSPDERAAFDNALVFAGHRPSGHVLRGASMLVHLARYDAFPVAVVEAMLAGVPPIVAGAGSATVVEAVEPRLHVADEGEAIQAAHWVRSLSDDEYRDLALRLRGAALTFIGSDPGKAGVEAIRRTLAA